MVNFECRNKDKGIKAVRCLNRFILPCILIFSTLSAKSIYAEPANSQPLWSNELPSSIAPTDNGYVASNLTGRLIGSPPALRVCVVGQNIVGEKLVLNPEVIDADEDIIKEVDISNSGELRGTKNSIKWFRINNTGRQLIAEGTYELALSEADLANDTQIEFQIQPFTQTGFPDYNEAILTGQFKPSDPETFNKYWYLDELGEVTVNEDYGNVCVRGGDPEFETVSLTAKITRKIDNDYIPVLLNNQEIPDRYKNDVAVDITKEEALDLPATGGKTYYLRFYDEDGIDVTEKYTQIEVNDSLNFKTAKKNFLKNIRWQLNYEDGTTVDVVFDRNDLSFTTQKTNDEEYFIYQDFKADNITDELIDNNPVKAVRSSDKKDQTQQKATMQIAYNDALLIKAPE